MAIRSDRLALAALAALGLAACAPFGSEQVNGAFDLAPQFGEALKYDMAIQTIDPEPMYVEGAEPGANGDAARAAAERYRKGTVKTVTTESTTQSVGGGSGSGAGSK